MSLAEAAKLFAIEAHESKHQVRAYTGEPYSVHLAEVAALVEKHGGSDTAVAAAWLHDVVEDTDVTLAIIEQRFGNAVAKLVKGLTDVSRAEDGSRAVRKRLDREHSARQVDECKTIKLCDVISNTRDIHKLDSQFASIYLREKLALLDVLRSGNSLLWQQAYLQISTGLSELAAGDHKRPHLAVD